MNGPDQIIEANSLISTTLDTPVKIRQMDLKKHPPISVPGMLDKMCKRYSSRVALSHKVNGKWEKISFTKYLQLVQTCAKGFLQLGLTPHSVVCIIGFNSPEWFIANLGAIYAGGIAAGIYTTNSPEACLHCLSTSKAKIVVVEDQTQLAKILEIKPKVPDLKVIVQYKGEVTQPDVLSWQQLISLGESADNSVLQSVKKRIAINQCCTLVYTSGTTGNPKGAMLSHDNVIYDAIKIGQQLGIKTHGEVYVSFLPLSHVAGNVTDIHCTYIHGCKVCFADKDALKGSLVGTFTEVQPTRILSVPRVWEKIYEKLQELSEKNKGLKKVLAAWAKKQGLNRNKARGKSFGHG